MKKCPRCAELVQDEAMVCRFCQHKLAKGTGEKIADALGIVALVVGVWLLGQCTFINPPASSESVDSETSVDRSRDFSMERVKECSALLQQARKNGLIREQPNADRINVDDRLWASFPASSKRGIMLALGCTRYGRPFEGVEGVVAYGYRSGRRVAMATSAGVTFE